VWLIAVLNHNARMRRERMMDADIFDQFIDQLGRYVRERLIPAEKDILESDVIPDAIVDEMRELGLFGLTMPEEYGGAAMTIAQYIRTIREP
jgi:acyl-CoA dehydrogenase